jgi:hypothetical protein
LFRGPARLGTSSAILPDQTAWQTCPRPTLTQAPVPDSAEIEFAVRCGGSAPSVRDSIDDKAVEEDNVARALDIFNGAFGVDVRF